MTSINGLFNSYFKICHFLEHPLRRCFLLLMLSITIKFILQVNLVRWPRLANKICLFWNCVILFVINYADTQKCWTQFMPSHAFKKMRCFSRWMHGLNKAKLNLRNTLEINWILWFYMKVKKLAMISNIANVLHKS